MAEIKSELVADFIPELVADFVRNQHIRGDRTINPKQAAIVMRIFTEYAAAVLPGP